MPLSLFAAETLVVDYLDGRVLPREVRGKVVLEARARLVSGQLPVLGEALRANIENYATPPPMWSEVAPVV